MNNSVPQSDQLNTWSDDDARHLDHQPQTPTQAVVASTSSTRCCATRLVDRTLQALWEAELPVRQWSGARAEVLLVGQSQRGSSGDGLRSPGQSATSGAIPRQLPRYPRHSRPAERDQSRVAAPTRTLLGAGGEQLILLAHLHRRHHCRRHVDGQHARGVAAGTRPFPLCRGGSYR